MVIATGDQRRPRRRAKGGRVELGVAQSGCRDAVERRRRDDPAECAGDAIALVVGHDEQNVRRALRRNNARRPIGRRLGRRFLDHAAERQRRRRKLAAVNRNRGAGGAGCAGYLLGRRRRAFHQCHKRGQRDPALQPSAIYVSPSWRAKFFARLPLFARNYAARGAECRKGRIKRVVPDRRFLGNSRSLRNRAVVARKCRQTP